MMGFDEAGAGRPAVMTGLLAATEAMGRCERLCLPALGDLIQHPDIEAAGVVVANGGRPTCLFGTRFSDKNAESQMWRGFEAHVEGIIGGSLSYEVLSPDGHGRLVATEVAPGTVPQAFLVTAVFRSAVPGSVEAAIRGAGRSIASALDESPPGSQPLSNDVSEKSEMDPVEGFLIGTLVEKPVMRGRGRTRYLTTKMWRSPIKSYQIEALRHLKRAPRRYFVDQIAGDLAREIDKLIGRQAFEVIVPMPCGGSGSASCLSTMIADRLGEALSAPVVHALSGELRKRSSHPKNNVTRPPMRLVREVAVPALVVDDVASSGQHMEEAITLLRQSSKAVVGIAWIGGEATQ